MQELDDAQREASEAEDRAAAAEAAADVLQARLQVRPCVLQYCFVHQACGLFVFDCCEGSMFPGQTGKCSAARSLSPVSRLDSLQQNIPCRLSKPELSAARQAAEADGGEAATLRAENAELHSSVEHLGAALDHAQVSNFHFHLGTCRLITRYSQNAELHSSVERA